MRNAIVYVTDRKGYELTRYSATSVLLMQQTPHDIHLCCYGFLPDDNDPLFALARKIGTRLDYSPINDGKVSRFKSLFETYGHITSTALLKFEAIDRFTRDYDRVLYLDGDVLLFGNLDLDTVGLDGNVIGAVYDIAEAAGLTDPEFPHNCRNVGRSPHYFNSGVLLVDCQRWRNMPELRLLYNDLVEAHAIGTCDYKTNCVTVDQCVLNRIFEGDWKRLPLGFNMQGCAMFTERWDVATVRHYVGRRKFLPVRRWRTDAPDVHLLEQIRLALRLPKLRAFGSSAIYTVNRLRNRTLRHKVNEAIARIDIMSTQATAPGKIAAPSASGFPPAIGNHAQDAKVLVSD